MIIHNSIVIANLGLPPPKGVMQDWDDDNLCWKKQQSFKMLLRVQFALLVLIDC